MSESLKGTPDFSETVDTAHNLLLMAQLPEDPAEPMAEGPVEPNEGDAGALALATWAVRMLRQAHGEGLDERSPDYPHARHVLAGAERITRGEAERGITWLQMARAIVLEGGREKAVEFLTTPDESVVVPFTEDGKIVLVERASPVLGTNITTVLSRARVANLEPDLVALQAMQKFSVLNLFDTTVQPTGITRAWKYLDSAIHHYTVDLPVDALYLEEAASAGALGSKTELIRTMSEEEFFAAVDDGKITVLRAIVAVQLALAQRSGMLQPTDGEPVILAPSHQAQALMLILNSAGVPWAFGLQVEPSLAQGERVLISSAGGIDEGKSGRQTGAKESVEESGFPADEARAVELVRPSHIMLLYLQHESEVWLYPLNTADRSEPTGGDELESEKAAGVVIPIDHIWWYFREGHLTDNSVIAGIFAYMRKYGTSRDASLS